MEPPLRKRASVDRLRLFKKVGSLMKSKLGRKKPVVFDIRGEITRNSGKQYGELGFKKGSQSMPIDAKQLGSTFRSLGMKSTLPELPDFPVKDIRSLEGIYKKYIGEIHPTIQALPEHELRQKLISAILGEYNVFTEDGFKATGIRADYIRKQLERGLFDGELVFKKKSMGPIKVPKGFKRTSDGILMDLLRRDEPFKVPNEFVLDRGPGELEKLSKGEPESPEDELDKLTTSEEKPEETPRAGVFSRLTKALRQKPLPEEEVAEAPKPEPEPPLDEGKASRKLAKELGRVSFKLAAVDLAAEDDEWWQREGDTVSRKWALQKEERERLERDKLREKMLIEEGKQRVSEKQRLEEDVEKQRREEEEEKKRREEQHEEDMKSIEDMKAELAQQKLDIEKRRREREKELEENKRRLEEKKQRKREKDARREEKRQRIAEEAEKKRIAEEAKKKANQEDIARKIAEMRRMTDETMASLFDAKIDVELDFDDIDGKPKKKKEDPFTLTFDDDVEILPSKKKEKKN